MSKLMALVIPQSASDSYQVIGSHLQHVLLISGSIKRGKAAPVLLDRFP